MKKILRKEEHYLQKSRLGVFMTAFISTLILTGVVSAYYKNIWISIITVIFNFVIMFFIADYNFEHDRKEMERYKTIIHVVHIVYDEYVLSDNEQWYDGEKNDGEII